MASRIAPTIHNGRVSTCSGGTTPSIASTGTSRTSVISSSTVAASTAATGASSRGKYTFVTRSRSSTSEFAAAVTAVETNVQTVRPASANEV